MAKQASSKTQGLKEGEERATVIVNSGAMEKLRNIAYWDRLSLKEVVSSAFEEYVKKYEKKNGEVKPRPAR